MVRFLIKIALFSVLFAGLVYAIGKRLSRNAESKNYYNYNIEDNVLITPEDTHFDFVMLGLSHARNFSRHKNHIRVEKILDMKFINYGKGGGFGNAANQYVFLKYFLSQGNTADQVLYALTMPMFFNEEIDRNAFTYQYEILNPDFFYQVLAGPDLNKGEKLYTYVRTKFKKFWRERYGPWSEESRDVVLEKIDTTVINEGFKAAYVNGLEFSAFERNKKIIIKTIELAQKNNMEITFFVTPSTFGVWPGHEHVMEFMQEMEKEYGVKTYDFSKIYLHQNEYFYDHHHLNTTGVEKFTKEYLKPLLNHELLESQ